MEPIEVYLEVGPKRTFAGAVEWPGWCRSGPDEESALRALFEYAPRYARALKSGSLGFQVPGNVSDFQVVERIPGNFTTDYGTPGIPPIVDARPISEDELQHLEIILRASWQAFDDAVQHAAGHELRKGPRGGGRELDAIARHVRDAEGAYLSKLGGKAPKAQEPDRLLKLRRQAILETLAASANHQIPATGPRGGLRWSPRYFIRRAAWHLLDHAWEIEDRQQ